MSGHADRRSHRARTAVLAAIACALLALAGALAATALAAHKVNPNNPLGISIPASARVKGTDSSRTTTAPASTQPSTTAPAATAPESGVQPGTVAPGTSTPGAPTTQTAPATTVPSGATTVPNAGAPQTTTTAPAGVQGSTAVQGARPGSALGAGHRGHRRGSSLSDGTLVLAIAGALLLLCCLAWAVGRWLAVEPRWTAALTHSARETAYRASTTWAEFSDWARLGH